MSNVAGDVAVLARPTYERTHWSAGYPAVGVELAYRNPRSEVVRFLETRHADQYFVYNFCAEQTRWCVHSFICIVECVVACQHLNCGYCDGLGSYPASVFASRTKSFPIEDHNVPTFEQLYVLCRTLSLCSHQLSDSPFRSYV